MAKIRWWAPLPFIGFCLAAVWSGRSPTPSPPAAPPPALISEGQATGLVWALPEIDGWRRHIQESGRDDVRLMTMVETRPDPDGS